MSAGDGVKRVKSREFTGISPLQLTGTGVKLVKTRVVFVGETLVHNLQVTFKICSNTRPSKILLILFFLVC